MRLTFESTTVGRLVIALLALTAIIMIGVPCAFSQEASAGITGRVTDPSGSAIAGASVRAKDIARGTEWPTQTNEEGIYSFPRIPIGAYELSIAAQGFKTLVRPGITLELNQMARVDVSMEVGAVSERVEVFAGAVLLQTEKAQVGVVVPSTSIGNAPLLTRNFIMLTLMAPGVTTVNPADFMSGARTQSGGRPYVNGNRKEANNFLLDGVDNNHVSDNLTAYQPNLDAIQEFNMITNNASAEFGNFQGGIINVTLKSGTNQFHGNMFEFLRNDKLNANNWARNWQGSQRVALRYNQFGGMFGGRIIRDRLFFFTDYQATRRASPGTASSISVIPAEFRGGDFSRLLREAAPAIQLFDPLTTDRSGLRQPFPNNRIPAGRINKVAQSLFAAQDLYPLPLTGDLRYNQINIPTSYLRTDQGDFKLDAKLTSKDDFSGRYSNSRQDTPGVNTFPLLYNSFGTAPFQAGVLNWTRLISPSMVNEARFGVNNITLENGGEDKGLGDLARKFGIAGADPGLPGIAFGGYASSIGSTNIGTQYRGANTTYHWADNVIVTRGRHMMKTGGQVLRQQMNTLYTGTSGRTGYIQFNGQYTAGPNAGSPAYRGFGEADFFLGYPYQLARGFGADVWGHRKTIFGFYFQDDWHATDALTLNLGLRWEYHTPLVEVKDRQSNFDRTTGQIMLAGKDGNSRALYNGFKKDWQPRVGFAWTPHFLGSKTVLRGAYTISSFMEGTGTALRLPMNPPFHTEYAARYDDPKVMGSTTDQGFTVIQAVADPYKGLTLCVWDPFVRPANTQQWNFTVERQLPADTVLSVAYVGQHGTHLVVPMPYHQRKLMPDRTMVAPPILSNPALKTITYIGGTEANGNQRYDGLQVNLRKRMGHGLQYQLSYTFSKGMSDAIGYYGEGGQAGSQPAYWQDQYNRKAEWGPTYFDAKHIFMYGYVYEFPFGRGKRYGGDWNPVVNGLMGGWQMAGMLSLHTGFPLTITGPDRSGTVSRGARADRIGNGEGRRQVGPGAAWFDTTAFKPAVQGTFGNSGVGVVRGPGLKAFSLSAQKHFAVTEKSRLEFRSEFYNLTNTPIFNSPIRNVISPTFGELTGAQGERTVQFALKLSF